MKPHGNGGSTPWSVGVGNFNPTCLQGHYCTYYENTGTEKVVLKWIKMHGLKR